MSTEGLQPGTQLDGRYEVVRLLGEGGMATVYEVRHLGLQSTHALKVLNLDLAQNEELRSRFLAEGRIQARLRHPHIVQVTEIVTSPVAGLVMDYVEGPTLGDYVHDKGPLGLDEVLTFFLPVLDAMEEAHKAGVVHRDLKPDNIILGRDSRGRVQPKVTDFGIAKLLRDEQEGGSRRRTQAGARMGTLLYMSPEQVRGADGVDARSDIFSLGAILYECVTGKVAFEARSDFDTMTNIVQGTFEPPERVVGALPPVLAGCIRKALAVDPAERFQDCAAFHTALAAVKDPDAQVLPRPSRSYAVTSHGAELAQPSGGAPPSRSTPAASPPAPAEASVAATLSAKVSTPAAAAPRSKPAPGALSRKVPPLAAPRATAQPGPTVGVPVVATPGKDISADVKTSPLGAMLLSMFCLAGLGQFYNQQVLKGAGLLMLTVGLFVSGAGPCGLVTMNLLAAADAYAIATKRRKGKSVGAWEFF